MSRYDKVLALLAEVEAEFQRGLMEGTLPEVFAQRFVVPFSKTVSGGIVIGEFNVKAVQPTGWQILSHRAPDTDQSSGTPTM